MVSCKFYLPFEGSVILYGSQTQGILQGESMEFESSVILYGSQTFCAVWYN